MSDPDLHQMRQRGNTQARPLHTAPPVATTAAAPVSVSVATTAIALLAANTNRVRAIIRNTGTPALLIGYSAGVTASNAPIRLTQHQVWVEDVVKTGLWGISEGPTATSAAAQELMA